MSQQHVLRQVEVKYAFPVVYVEYKIQQGIRNTFHTLIFVMHLFLIFFIMGGMPPPRNDKNEEKVHYKN